MNEEKIDQILKNQATSFTVNLDRFSTADLFSVNERLGETRELLYPKEDSLQDKTKDALRRQ